MKVIKQKKSNPINNTNENSILSIDMSNLHSNWKELNKKIKNSELAVSIKANAYGLGYEQVAKELITIGCGTFFVATYNEALAIRKLNNSVKIFLLSNSYSKDLNYTLIMNNIYLVINNKRDLKKINNLSKLFKKKIKCALQFDVGMSRLGFDFADLDYVSKYLKRSIDVNLIIAHLSCSEDKNSQYNKTQINIFKKIKKYFDKYNFSFSLANSNAVYLGKEYHYDMCRVGGLLYGLNLTKNLPKGIKTVTTLKSKILQIRSVAKGCSIGYGASYIVKKNSKIATLGIGYADGIPRNYNGYALYKGKKIRFVGNISMDLSNLDVTNVTNINENDWVEIFSENLSINIVANKCNTISYEIVSRLGNRVERVYLYNK